MANRVLLGALDSGGFGLRVSRPGFDVTNASLPKEQLAFDSRWSEVSNVWMSGTLAWAPTLQTSGSQWQGYGYCMILNFGTTFAYPPIVMCSKRRNTTDFHLGNSLDSSPQGVSGVITTVATVDSACILGPVSGDSLPVHYIVLRNTAQNG